MRFLAILLVTIVACAWGADFAEDPICDVCPGEPAGVAVSDAVFKNADLDLWQCPECGRYYWSGAWHDVATYENTSATLRKKSPLPPEKCPFCGGALHETNVYVMETPQGDKPSYLCATCFGVVMPDGRALTAEQVKELESGRREDYIPVRARELAEEYGWPSEKAKRVAAGKIAVGDDAKAVREAWGQPVNVERDISPKGGVQERWLYGGGRDVSLRDGVVTAFDDAGM